jgi:hypothetical protein
MTTNITAGQKIRIAVPITPEDNSPFEKRRAFRISTVEIVRENGIIEETEGTVRVDRMGIDWEICESEPESQEGNLLAVAMKAGPVIASVIRVKGKYVEAYSDQAVPCGIMLPASGCGKMWDWLKGRTLSEASKGLTEIFCPNPGRQPAEPGQAGPGAAAPTTGKKRGPKPRAVAVTATTEVLPATPDATVCPRVFSFEDRARLWHAAKRLMESVASDDPQWLVEIIPTALRNMDDVMTSILKGAIK